MTSVTRRATWILAAALPLAVLAAPPALAGQPSDPVSGLVGELLGSPDGSGHHRDRSDYGHTRAPDGRLLRGCHDYPYRYVVTPPTDDWTLETFLRDRTGESVASDTYSSDSDPARARADFRFCRYSVHAGRFTIRAKLNWYNGSHDHQVWLEPSHFRLRRH